MNRLDQLSVAWRWAQQKQIIAPEFVEHHINNMRDAMNNGRIIKPSITFDCMGTLIPKCKDTPPNVNLYNAGKGICSHQSITRHLALASSKRNAPIFAAEQLDDDFKGVACGKDEYNRRLSWFGYGKERYEILIDDLGIGAEYAESFVTVFEPTWDRRLIAFPKLR